MMNLKSKYYKNDAQREYDISEEKREWYREISRASREAKIAAENGLLEPIYTVNMPKLNPNSLMPQLKNNNIKCLSLFSGGGGLDLGFDKAGFQHCASYELIPICGDTLRKNRPEWNVYAGEESGDVTKINWKQYNGKIDLIHGGPPCQPFSIAGQQKGLNDHRNMWPEFNRAVNEIKPKVFIAENVLGLLNPKFEDFVQKFIIDELKTYHIKIFEMHAASYGIPQVRRRVFFVGFKNINAFNNYKIPQPTHSWEHLVNGNNASEFTPSLFNNSLPKTMGVRESLGLENIGYDSLAPTLRSGFTGKRNTTSILNSKAGQKSWGDMIIWPNGVQINREKASFFPAENGHFRLSVQDCALLQGFPEDWKFSGAVYQVIGQIGNSVVPPVAYSVANSLINLVT